MTNLLAAIVITLSTNVSTYNNAVAPSCCYAVHVPGRSLEIPDQTKPYGEATIPGKPATEQTELFTVIRTTEAVFTNEGQRFSQKIKEETIRRWEVKYVPAPPWRPVATNDVAATNGYHFVTNGSNVILWQ